MSPNKNDKVFTFTVDKETLTVKIERSFDAPLAMVWSAWTEAAILDQWWGPQPYRAETKDMDFREGGRRLYAMVGPQGERHWAVNHYLKINPKKNFSHRSTFCDENGNVNPATTSSTWINAFTEKDGVTLVTNDIRCETLEHLEAQIKMGFKEGYTVCLNQLEELVADLQKKGG